MAQDRRGDNGEDRVLEGEIIRPGPAPEDHVEIKVIRLGWFQRIVLAAVVLCVLALALFISFWVLVVSIPLLMIAAVWSWFRRRAGGT